MKLETITQDIAESKVKITSIDLEIMKLNRQKDKLNEYVREQTTKEKALRSNHLLQDAKMRDQKVKLEEMKKQGTEIELAMVKLAEAPGYRYHKIYSILSSSS